MFDETQSKIIQAAMELVMERGYASATTKDIARRAGVNESTIFRRFRGKKEIVLSAMKLPEWNPGLKKEDFTYVYDLEKDLMSFARRYMEKVTPKMVKVSMGLRAPELFADTAKGIMEIPCVFKEVLETYFQEMRARGLIESDDAESLAMTFLSLNFGFVFLKGSFHDQLTSLENEAYIKASVHSFVNGIRKK